MEKTPILELFSLLMKGEDVITLLQKRDYFEEKEKAVIIEAYASGCDIPNTVVDKIMGEQYYKETFKQ